MNRLEEYLLQGLRIEFKNDKQLCVIRESYMVFGLISFAVSVYFSKVFIIQWHNNALSEQWVMHLIFCMLFGWLGLYAALHSRKIIFDRDKGRFVLDERGLFKKTKISGILQDIRFVQIATERRRGSPMSDHPTRWDRQWDMVSIGFQGRLLEIFRVTSYGCILRNKHLAGGATPEEISAQIAAMIGCKLQRIDGKPKYSED